MKKHSYLFHNIFDLTNVENIFFVETGARTHTARNDGGGEAEALSWLHPTNTHIFFKIFLLFECAIIFQEINQSIHPSISQSVRLSCSVFSIAPPVWVCAYEWQRQGWISPRLFSRLACEKSRGFRGLTSCCVSVFRKNASFFFLFCLRSFFRNHKMADEIRIEKVNFLKTIIASRN